MGRHSFRQLWQQLWQSPDQLMLEIGAGGEHLIAKIRVTTVLILLLLPIVHLATGGPLNEALIGGGGTALALIFSLIWLRLSRPGIIRPWLPFASTSFDISLISFVLVLLAIEEPSAALNSLVSWNVYLLAIFVTALRNDLRVTLLAGALAIAQFGGLWLYLESQSFGPIHSDSYGTVLAANMHQRLLVLAASCFLTAAVVIRMQRMVDLSGYDRLTGLPNRIYFQHRAKTLIAEALAQGRELSLALIDIERMRIVNERFGMETGDQAIKHFAGHMQQAFPGQESLMRLEGQTFVQILDLPLANALDELDQARRKLLQQAFVSKDNIEVLLSFNAGLVCCPHDGLDLAALMKRANERLDTAKQGGLSRTIARS